MFGETFTPGERVEVDATNKYTKGLYSGKRGFVVARPEWVKPPFHEDMVYVQFDGQKSPEIARRDHLRKLGLLDRIANEDVPS